MDIMSVEAIAARQKEIRERLRAIERRAEEIRAKIRGLSSSVDPTAKDQVATLQAEYSQLEKEAEQLQEELNSLMLQKKLHEFAEIVKEGAAAVEKYRPFIMDVINQNRPEFSGILKDLVGIVLDIGDDLREERNRILKNRAEMLYQYYQSLIGAKFTEEQAMQIILSHGSGSGLFSLVANTAGKVAGDVAGKIADKR